MAETDKLALGTVQLGLEYGVGNKRGKPPRGGAIRILEHAYKNGVKIFDTASLYGDAEEILGEFAEKNNLKDEIAVISKLGPVEDANSIKGEIKNSLERLKLEKIDGYLIHRAEDFYKDDILKGLAQCKTEGLVENIGVSVYEKQDALATVSSGKIDYIQIPYNVFDQRLNQTDFFDIAQRNKVKIFARSAFLQGVLLMEEDDVPQHLRGIIPRLEEFTDIIRAFGFSRREAAFLFPYTHPKIDHVVFGVDTVEQLEENISIIKKLETHNFEPCFNALKNKFLDIDKTLIRPDLWETLKK